MSAETLENNPLTIVDGVPASFVSVADRGFQFADGFFETMLCFEGDVPLKTLHWRRIEDTSRRLKFNLQLACIEQYLQQFLRLRSEQSAMRRSAIKIIISRGIGGRGYIPPARQSSSVTITERPVSDSGPVVLHECVTRLGENPSIAGLKHLSRLEYCLAGLELGAGEEGLLLSVRGQVIETLHANIFWVIDGALFTPSLHTCGVRGVLRQHLLATVLPKLGLTIAEVESTPEQLVQADEVFVCNAVRGVRPVQSLAKRNWPTGPITHRVQQELKREFGDAFY